MNENAKLDHLDEKALRAELGKWWEDVKGLKEAVGSFQGADALTKEQLATITAKMDAIEVKLQAPRSANGAATMQLDRKARARWGKHLGMKPADVTADTIEEAKADFDAYLRQGVETKTLRTDSNVDGGFLVYPEFADFIIKDLLEVSPVRSIARVRQTSTNVFKAPVRKTLPAAQWLGEEQEDDLTNAGYGLEEVPNGTLRATTRATREQLEDAAFDIESEVRADMVEQFAFTEGVALVNGDGVSKPKGFMQDARVDTTPSGAAAEVTYAGLINVSHALNLNYLANARFVMNLRTLGAIRLLEDSEGNLIYAPGVADVASTVVGFPFTILQAMPDVGAGNEPIAFGDFGRGYLVIDRVSFSLLRDPYSAKRVGAVEFTGYHRVGGQVILPQALRKLRIATS